MEFILLSSLFCLAVGGGEYTFSMPVYHLTTVRADPIIVEGKASAHVHQVYGGNGFGLTQSYEDAKGSTCNTSPYIADKSNYWTNALYRVNPNGTFTLVPTAKVNIYYVFRDDGRGVKAFPEGFRMVAHKDVGMEIVCGHGQRFKTLDELVADPRECGVMQVRMGMPECYDGRLDSDNHVDHVKKGGPWDCPDSHPHRLPGIGFEFEYDYDKSKQEVLGATFIFADSTKEVHGDFLNGWDVDVLQELIDECIPKGDKCEKVLKYHGNNVADCKIDGKTLVNEEVVHVETLPSPESAQALVSRAGAIGGECFGLLFVVLALCTL